MIVGGKIQWYRYAWDSLVVVGLVQLRYDVGDGNIGCLWVAVFVRCKKKIQIARYFLVVLSQIVC